MNIFEKFMREYLVECDQFEIILERILLDLVDYYETKENLDNLAKKIWDFLNYLTHDNFFYLKVKNPNGSWRKIEINDPLFIEQIENFLAGNDIIQLFYFYLTDKGKSYVNEYLEKHKRSCENIIKSFENKNYSGFEDLFKIVNQEYRFSDLEEFRFEIQSIVVKLFFLNLITTGEFKNEIFYQWDSSTIYKIDEKLFEELTNLKDYPKNGDIGWLELTSEGRRVLSEWKVKGGRIKDYWIVPKYTSSIKDV